MWKVKGGGRVVSVDRTEMYDAVADRSEIWDRCDRSGLYKSRWWMIWDWILWKGGGKLYESNGGGFEVG